MVLRVRFDADNDRRLEIIRTNVPSFRLLDDRWEIVRAMFGRLFRRLLTRPGAHLAALYGRTLLRLGQRDWFRRTFLHRHHWELRAAKPVPEDANDPVTSFYLSISRPSPLAGEGWLETWVPTDCCYHGVDLHGAIVVLCEGRKVKHLTETDYEGCCRGFVQTADLER